MQNIGPGDIVGIKYNGWLENNFQKGSLFDTNTTETNNKILKFKIGDGKVIKGWEEGIKGMKKGGKRILIIPPDMMFSIYNIPYSKLQNVNLPSNIPCIFEVSIIFYCKILYLFRLKL